MTCRRSDVMSKGKKRSGARPGRPQPLRGTKGKRKGARLDRKSGSAGMPRPISYAVFCLKKKSRGPVPGGPRCDLEEAEEVRDPSDEDDEDTADEERKLRNARPGSPHPVVESGEAHLVSAVRRFSEGRVPKAFMASAANRPFRSRSLVRSRIGAFRASDAGSNPAGSIPKDGQMVSYVHAHVMDVGK